ncbi:hypothetical protein PV396_17690 [Streptomyces sp. ME02-8801-2C]|uniref:hypothetical protein n=1 Tax=Streptomyces sp. ME02-8801-2C TaxID=3028680 RepID=UPI0029B43FCC|nr:hypothetical protein [Streptomyces sp. ME02-8801-2C]MDX3453764.1 hypothetical protein [Streptomyces sp. ME02-8801-2C]
MTAPANLSTECTVGREPGYQNVHAMCRQTRDVSLPHSTGILLIARCTCTCHKESA